MLSEPWFLWTSEEPEAREVKGCSGHSVLRVGPGSKGWVSWEWWPQKSTVWITEIRELVFPKTLPSWNQMCPVAQVEMATYCPSRGLCNMIPLISPTRGHKPLWGPVIPLKEGGSFVPHSQNQILKQLCN